MGSFEPSPALFTDLYELTMAQAYWAAGVTGPATFSMYFRKLPYGRGYLVAAGLESVLGYLERFRFTDGDLAYLRSLSRFEEPFLAFLADVRFMGSVRAMPEGTVFFPDEPVLEVTSSVIEAQLVETFVVNQVHLQTVLATKAARVRTAARDRHVIDFGARRCHGTEAANLAARAGYLVGFDGTSNTMAAALYEIDPFGTMAHSFVCAFPSEIDAFRGYANTFPDAAALLVDTYDTVEGVRKALAVATELRRQGHEVRAVRLDSGDLLALSRAARRMADAAGFPALHVFVSGGLDEYEVDALVRAGAPIDAFGVGTRVGVSADAPCADCAYKLVEYAGRPVLKLSAKKQTLPGPKQVFRRHGPDGRMLYDVVARAAEAPPGDTRPLLVDVMGGGRRVGPHVPLAESRLRCRTEVANLPDRHKALESPAPFEVRFSEKLARLTREVVSETRRRELPGAEAR
jgi:nicotinate phosphoribosyltransferase